jgi:hypothetical protein
MYGNVDESGWFLVRLPPRNVTVSCAPQPHIIIRAPRAVTPFSATVKQKLDIFRFPKKSSHSVLFSLNGAVKVLCSVL